MTRLPLEIQTRLSRSPISHLKTYPTIKTHEEYKTALRLFISEFLLYHLLIDYNASTPNPNPVPAGVEHFLRVNKNMCLQIIEWKSTKIGIRSHPGLFSSDIYSDIDIEHEVFTFFGEYPYYIRRPHFHKQDQDPKFFARFIFVCVLLKIDPKIKDVDSFLKCPYFGSPTYSFMKRILETHSQILKLDSYPVITTLDQFKQAHQAFKKEASLYRFLCRYTYPQLDGAPHVQHFSKMLLQLGSAMIAWHDQEEKNRDFVTECSELIDTFRVVQTLTSYLQHHDDTTSQEMYQDLTRFVVQRKADLVI